MVFHLNLLEKAYFFQASQFWQMESALSFDVVIPTLIDSRLNYYSRSPNMQRYDLNFS